MLFNSISTTADAHVNDELWHQCLRFSNRLNVVEMMDVIGDNFNSKFGPFSRKTLESEKKFKKIFQRRIIKTVQKLKVLTRFPPFLLSPLVSPRGNDLNNLIFSWNPKE